MTITSSHSAITATGLRKSFGDQLVLDGIDLAVPQEVRRHHPGQLPVGQEAVQPRPRPRPVARRQCCSRSRSTTRAAARSSS
jgi:hypothetical protein